ncbi:MAG: hypothetical protein ACLQO1_19490 [Steroidobacteraceae bacterium]
MLLASLPERCYRTLDFGGCNGQLAIDACRQRSTPRQQGGHLEGTQRPLPIGGDLATGTRVILSAPVIAQAGRTMPVRASGAANKDWTGVSVENPVDGY